MATSSSTTMTPTYGPIEGPYHGTGALVCCYFFTAFSTIIVGLRLTAKYVSASRWGWDDYLLVPTLLLALYIYTSMIYMMLNLGGGYHVQDVAMSDPSKLVLFDKLTVANTVLLGTVLALPRCCILATYLRIFVNKKLRILTWILMGVTIAYAVLATIINLVVCIPLEAIWNPAVKGTCINETAWWGYATIPVAVFDIATMALPVSTITQLQRPLHERLGLLAVFLAYAFGTVAEVARIIAFNEISEQQDRTWTSVSLMIASVCEVSAYLIACCMPGLRPLWLRLRGQDSRSSSLSAFNKSRRTEHTGLWSGQEMNSLSELVSCGGPGSAQHEAIFKSSRESLKSNEIKVTRDFVVS